MGATFKVPEKHCCGCGKPESWEGAKTDAPTGVLTVKPTSAPTATGTSAGCVDTPGWSNGNGKGCKDYPTNKWCVDGKVLVKFTVSANFRNPDQHCCACGKGQ